TYLRRALRQRISFLVELVRVEIIVNQTKKYGHSISGRRRVRELSRRIVCPVLNVISQGILDIRTQSDQFRSTEAISGKGGGRRGCAVPNKPEIEACRYRVLTFGPCQIVGRIQSRQALVHRASVEVLQGIEWVHEKNRT